jgi:hypothetical protein
MRKVRRQEVWQQTIDALRVEADVINGAIK